MSVMLVVVFLQAAEQRLAGEPYLEALVIAILLGGVGYTAWTPRALASRHQVQRPNPA